MTPDQIALKDLAKETTNGGRKPLSVSDANTVLDWADEIKYPGVRASANDVAFPNPHWKSPHIHLPGTGYSHIPVAPGVTPR